jgi:hypothetical protein
MRVMGLNDRWSAYCFDKTLGKARPVGVLNSVGYVRFDPEYADVTSAQVGHPIIADRPEVVLLFTQVAEAPSRYMLQINNPTDQPLTVKLQQAMDLPDLNFEDQTLTLNPGELREISSGSPAETVTMQ